MGGPTNRPTARNLLLLLTLLLLQLPSTVPFGRPLSPAKIPQQSNSLPVITSNLKVSNISLASLTLFPPAPYQIIHQCKIVSMNPSGCYVDCSIYSLTGKNQNRAVLINGRLPSKCLPPGVSLACLPFIPRGTKKVLKVGDMLPPNSIFVSDVLVSNRKYFLGLLMDPTNATECDETIAKAKKALGEKALTRRLFRRRTKVSKLKAGDVKTGTVTRIESYGVFVDVNARRDGLLHIEAISKHLNNEYVSVNSFSDVGFGIGEEVNVVVKQVYAEKGRFELGVAVSDDDDYDTDDDDAVTTVAASTDDKAEDDEVDEDYDEDDDIEDNFF